MSLSDVFGQANSTLFQFFIIVFCRTHFERPSISKLLQTKTEGATALPLSLSPPPATAHCNTVAVTPNSHIASGPTTYDGIQLPPLSSVCLRLLHATAGIVWHLNAKSSMDAWLSIQPTYCSASQWEPIKSHTDICLGVPRVSLWLCSIRRFLPGFQNLLRQSFMLMMLFCTIS